MGGTGGQEHRGDIPLHALHGTPYFAQKLQRVEISLANRLVGYKAIALRLLASAKMRAPAW